MLRHYQVLLTEIVANPKVSISSCPLVLPEAQQRQSLLPGNDFNDFEKAEIEQTIPQRFAAQVKRHPNRLAIKTTTRRWTYAELNQAANRVAHSILEQTGGKSTDSVALLFDHDAPMVAAMIGALKAGKAYVPLDPASPAERLLQIVNDAGARVLVTNNLNQKVAGTLTVEGLRVINVDKLRRARTDDVEVPADPGSLAYLLYTSGSTGQPKGVMQNHRNVLHFIRAYTNNLRLNANDRLSLFSSYCFDASVMDIYGALLNGAALYPIDIKKQGFDGAIKFLLDEAISVYHSTPTVYRHFVKSIGNEKFPGVRLVVLGGEPVNRTDVDLYKQHFPEHAVMINGLGPTEATVSLQYFINKNTSISGQSVPVGAPVAETEVLLLDEGTKSKGIAGEIALRCDHVALGYWRNEQATTAAFLTDENGARIYRTGDLGRRLPDGSILFTGRKDSQVKIRGFRVELGEIETALNRHASVKENVVALRTLSSGEKLLVAYLVPAANQSVQHSDLRRYLSTSLPEYMVPTVYVTLASLPLTASGKVNRRALPEPTLPESPARQARPLSSRSAVETALAAVWAEVLGLKVVGFHDNFFELGGHSLLAVILFARIAKYFGKRLPLATLFRAPTVAQLAAVIEDAGTPGWSSLVPIQPSGSRPPFFCVHAKGGNVLEYYDLARHLGNDQPFYGLQSQGLNRNIEPHTRISDMAAHYVGQIKEVQPNGPYFLGGRSMGGTIAYEMACQLRETGEEVALLALLDTYPSGYLHHLPGENALGPKVRRVRQRVKCHSTNMSGLPLREQFRYLMEKACFAPPRLKTLLWRKTYRLFKKLGRRLPSALCNVNEFNSLAGAEYAPQPYPGVVTLFWASADRRASFDLVDGWRVLAEGGIEIHEISGSHLNLIKEPYVTELAQKLARCLKDAQKKVTPTAAQEVPVDIDAPARVRLKMAS
jgi:amino acid adenylation domain-containing protein